MPVSVARADQTMEIDAIDILEAHAADGPSIPVVVDTSELPVVSAFGDRRRVMLAVVGSIMAGCLTLLVVAIARPHAAGTSAAAPLRAASATALSVPPVTPSDTGWAPVPTATVVATSGTIMASSKSITIDGTRLTSSVATVTCGKHSLRLGRGPARNVVVPCGGTLAVERDGSMSVR